DPHALVADLVAARAERHRRLAAPAPALATLAEEDLVLARADAAERRRIAPIPAARPSELLEPDEARLDVRDVEDRDHFLRVHADSLPDVMRARNACVTGPRTVGSRGQWLETAIVGLSIQAPAPVSITDFCASKSSVSSISPPAGTSNPWMSLMPL